MVTMARLAGGLLLVLCVGCAGEGGASPPQDAGPPLCPNPGALVTTSSASGFAAGKLTVTKLTPDPGNATKMIPESCGDYVINGQLMRICTPAVRCDDVLANSSPFSFSKGVVGQTDNFPLAPHTWTLSGVVTGQVGGPYGPGCSYLVTYYATSPVDSTHRQPDSCKWTIETSVVLF